MQAGSLRQRVTLERATEARDAYGAVTVTWSTLATVWADVQPAAGREYWSAAQTVGEGALRVRIRHFSGLTSKDRLVWDDRNWDIRSVADVGARTRELELVCTEAPP